jgi:hypothetical protein
VGGPGRGSTKVVVAVNVVKKTVVELEVAEDLVSVWFSVLVVGGFAPVTEACVLVPT